MKSKHPDLSRATRRTPLVLILAVVLLIMLAGTVWAAWGAARALPIRASCPWTPSLLRAEGFKPELKKLKKGKAAPPQGWNGFICRLRNGSLSTADFTAKAQSRGVKPGLGF